MSGELLKAIKEALSAINQEIKQAAASTGDEELKTVLTEATSNLDKAIETLPKENQQS